MKEIFLIITIFLNSLLLAQRYEAGLFIGGANAIADVGNEAYLAPKTIAIGGFLKRNLNERYSIRLSGTFSRLRMEDKDSKSKYRTDRKLTRGNHIGEGALIFEFNFFDFNGEHQNAQTPYLFIGIGGFSYKKNGFEIAPNGSGGFTRTKRVTYNFSPTIPFGLGYRYKFNYHWVIGAEAGFRATFTDNLDKGDPSTVFDSRLTDRQIQAIKDRYPEVRKIGNLNSNDWYVFTGITFSYTFGRKPCYCK